MNVFVHLAIGHEDEEETSDDGAKALSNPVEETGYYCDVATDGEAECHGGVKVSTGDVGGYGNTDKKGKGVSHRDSDKTSRIQGCIGCELGKSKSRTNASKHKEKSCDKFRQVSLKRCYTKGVTQTSNLNLHHFDPTR